MTAQPKSLWFWRGATATLAAALLFGAARLPQLDNTGARYQVVVNPGSVRDTYLVDTVTGSTWRLAAANVESSSVPILGWAKVDQLNLRAEADPAHR